MKVSIVIPCYNEEENILTLYGEIQKVAEYGLDVEYIFVDNGSADRTYDELMKVTNGGKYKLVRVPKNIGYGFGIQMGIYASTGDYVGWIHGDIQIHPKNLEPMFAYLANYGDGKHFLKGHRTNRSLLDRFFTFGQGVVNSLMFHKKMRDIAAIPAIYPAEVIRGEITDTMPNDFSIELFAYLEALKANLIPVRFDVVVNKREKGKSSWNTGLRSKIRQSRRIYRDSIKIKKGLKVT